MGAEVHVGPGESAGDGKGPSTPPPPPPPPSASARASRPQQLLLVVSMTVFVLGGLLGIVAHDWVPELKRLSITKHVAVVLPYTAYGHTMYDECVDCSQVGLRWRPVAVSARTAATAEDGTQPLQRRRRGSAADASRGPGHVFLYTGSPVWMDYNITNGRPFPRDAARAKRAMAALSAQKRSSSAAGGSSPRICRQTADFSVYAVQQRGTCEMFCSARGGARCLQAGDASSSGMERCEADEKPLTAEGCGQSWGTKICICTRVQGDRQETLEDVEETGEEEDLAAAAGAPEQPWQPLYTLLPPFLGLGYSTSAAVVRPMLGRTWYHTMCARHPFEVQLAGGEVRSCNELYRRRTAYDPQGANHTRAVFRSVAPDAPASRAALLCVGVVVLGTLLFWAPVLLRGLRGVPVENEAALALAAAQRAQACYWGWMQLSTLLHFGPALTYGAAYCWCVWGDSHVYLRPLGPWLVEHFPHQQIVPVAYTLFGFGLLSVGLSWRRLPSLVFHVGILLLSAMVATWVITLGLMAVWAWMYFSLLLPRRQACWMMEWWTITSTLASGITKLEAGWPTVHSLACFVNCPNLFRPWLEGILPAVVRG